MNWRRGNPQKIFRKSEKNWLFVQTSDHRIESKNVFSEIESRYYQIKDDKKQSKVVVCRENQLFVKLRKLEKKIPELKREISSVFGKTMPGSEIEELLKSEYALEEERIREHCSKFQEGKSVKDIR